MTTRNLPGSVKTWVIGTALSLFAMCAGIQYAVDDYKDTLKKLDSASVTFNSVADCQKQGFSQSACQQSQMKAELLARSTAAKAFSFKDDCRKQFLICEEEKRKGLSTYYPTVVAWQASPENLMVCAPLYPALKKDTVIRSDDKVFSLEY